ncbi:hypothetical protein NUACC26_016570 [Scytonema sp. NUACC26]
MENRHKQQKMVDFLKKLFPMKAKPITYGIAIKPLSFLSVKVLRKTVFLQKKLQKQRKQESLHETGLKLKSLMMKGQNLVISWLVS